MQEIMSPDDLSLFRSQPMEYATMTFPKEAAYSVVKALGKQELVMFTNLNEDKPAAYGEYNHQLARCAELERVLRVFQQYAQKYSVNLDTSQPEVEIPEGMDAGMFAEMGMMGNDVTIDSIESDLVARERYLNTLCSNTKDLELMLHRSREKILALEKAGPYIGGDSSTGGGFENSLSGGLLGGAGMALEGGASLLSNLVGALPKTKRGVFEKIMYRATRGNVILNYIEADQVLYDRQSGEMVEKYVFVAFLQGDSTYNKVRRICDVVGANVYDYDSSNVRNDIEAEKALFKDQDKIVTSSQYEVRGALNDISSNYASWHKTILQDKAIYHTLNKFKYPTGESGEYVVAEGWLPTLSMEKVRTEVAGACKRANVAQLGATVGKGEPHGHHTCPPTYYVVNKYTYGFQAIVEAYGVARYREHNPTPYTIVTFPFLFAVMFGDAGHGLLLLMLALYFIYNEKKLGADKLNDMIQMPFDGRYVLFLMSVFAIYCGFLYNEFFGMPLDIWGGTRWHYGSSEAAVTGANGMGTMAGGYKECSTIGATTPSGATTLSDGPTYWDHTKKYTDFAATKFVDSEDPDRYNPDGNYPDWADVFDDKTMLPGCTLPPKEPYPFGMDPIWKYSAGGLVFFNSLKMKMSVIFGVIQMVFGILVKASNAIEGKKSLDFWCEFLPQIIFMNGLFGYMICLIWIKYMTSWVPADQVLPGGVPLHLLGDPITSNDAPMTTGNYWYKYGKYEPCPPDKWCMYSQPVNGQNAVNYTVTDGGLASQMTCDPPAACGESMPPDIKQVMIGMAMQYGVDKPSYNLFPNMNSFHRILLPFVAVMPLIMLLPKPLIQNSQHQRGTLQVDPADPHGAHFEFGEVLIHQVIETIEFVLGAISNTASYLRLWALSLAHAQLTDVFFEKLLGLPLSPRVMCGNQNSTEPALPDWEPGSRPGAFLDPECKSPDSSQLSSTVQALSVFVGFAVWLTATFCVLMVMESLSAVLHALRLHWVEFQNKFYKGDGRKFEPFSFKTIEEEE